MKPGSNSRSHIVIIGAGITGLAAAYRLQQAAQTQAQPVRYTLIESTERIGGKLKTEMIDGYGSRPFVIEGGPDCFITQKPWALSLARELGLEDRLLGTNDDQRKVYVLNKGRPTPLPDGVLLIVPTKFMPFALSPLISPLGKLRMGMDLFISPKRDDEDETLADFITRRLGNEALDKIAEPLMSGIYNAEADRQSVMATFPRFRAIERKHGSLIKGMLASRRARSGSSSAETSSSHNGKSTSIFMSLRDGTQELAAELHKRLTGDVQLGTTVTSIAATDGGYRLEIESDDAASTVDADGVLITTPAYVSAALVRDVVPQAADLLEQIRYVSTGTVSLAYRDEDLRDTISGFGLVIPHSERRPINAVTFSSTKFDHRAPSGYSLLRVFFGGSRSPQTMELEDDALMRVVRSELSQILGIDGEPLFHRIYRWHRANPQYDIGHIDRVEEIERQLPERLFVAGSPFRGVGIPDCVHQAEIAVDKLIASLQRDHAGAESVPETETYASRSSTQDAVEGATHTETIVQENHTGETG